MRFASLAIVSLCLLVVNAEQSANDQLARGWGDAITWRSLEDGLKEAQSDNKHLMLLIHKSWCGACKSLKPKFAESKEIAKLSQNFVMVNVQDDEEPKGAEYSPDGGYIPRILFLTPDGEVRNEIINEGGFDKYKYYYPSTDGIVKSMHKVINSNSEQREDL